MIGISIAIAFVVYIWLRTNAFVDYLGWLLGPKNILHVGEYRRDGLGSAVEYPLWLTIKHTSFISKLVSCPLCCCFWLNLLFAPSIVSWLVQSYISLMAFSLLDRIYKK